MATSVEQRISIGAVARHSGDVHRQNQPDLADGDASDKLLKAFSASRRYAAEAEIRINDVHSCR